MKTYLVGGAVRDLLMGREPDDRDYVVIGSTPAEMLKAGFNQVGADFPVFLHPETGEEYALARTERKTGNGYGGFSTEFAGVPLEDDLARRDLTCNAIAIDLESDAIIDPFNGRADIENKLLRHTSPAFREDPVRVLRVARLAAKLDFGIAPETAALCREMIAVGELDQLTPERVRQELIKTLSVPNPSRFFTALDEVGALQKLFPEVHALKGQSQPANHHQEGDAYVHTLMVIDSMHRIATQEPVGSPLTGKDEPKVNIPMNVFAALCHDLGKGLTPKDALPRHLGHEEAGVPVTQALCNRLKMPADYERVAVKATRFHGHVHMARVLNPRTYNRLFEDLGGITQLADIETVARVGLADETGRIYDRKGPYRDHVHFAEVMKAVAGVRLRNAYSPEQLKAMKPEQLRQAQDTLRARAAGDELRQIANASNARMGKLPNSRERD